MVRAKALKYQNHFRGLPNESDFALIEETLPEVKHGEFLAEAVYISVDPYMRSFLSPGEIFGGDQVAKIIESKNGKYPVGEYVVGNFGWRTHTIATEKAGRLGFPPPKVLPDIGNLPKSLALGVLGMPGHTAYYGLLDLGKPKDGNTVVISAAGGAVGSHVGQIAKIKGCKAVGITGSDEKGEWLVKELGFDAYVNYKDSSFKTSLEQATPDGIDVYFDNVGGEISSTVLNKMNKFGRVVVCGSISTYNSDPKNLPKASEVQTPVKVNHLHMEGMNVFGYVDRWDESFTQNLQWIQEGKLKYKETITNGFENLITAFNGLFSGSNTGKSIVKV